METGDDRPVAVVLGAAVWAGGRPSPTLQRRAEAAARLWLAGRVRLILACGGQGRHAPSEAAVIRQICEALGVPGEAVLLEARSTTTEENFRFALPLLRAADAAAVIVVTDGYHQPRARLVARRMGLRAGSVSPPVPRPLTAQQVRLWLREAVALLGYALSGKGRG
jgi:uncharacterized SAM-binding protein YcdF (DUF218 family)